MFPPQDIALRYICEWMKSKYATRWDFLERLTWYSKTCVSKPPSRLTLNSGWCGKSCLSYKGTCHVILLAKLHDMYLYKTTTFSHQPLRSISKVAVLHRFYCIHNSATWTLVLLKKKKKKKKKKTHSIIIFEWDWEVSAPDFGPLGFGFRFLIRIILYDAFYCTLFH